MQCWLPVRESAPARDDNLITSSQNYAARQFSRVACYAYKYFLNVLDVTATLSANSVANGSTMNVGCRLNGSAR